MQEIQCDVAILGAGSAGMYALREVKRANKSFVIVDPGPLGTTCARVGCMPSKLALHAAGLWHSRQHFTAYGISGSEHLHLDSKKTWAALRSQRDQFSGSASNKARAAAGAQLIMGRATFTAPHILQVECLSGALLRIHANAIVIATGSHPALPAAIAELGDRVLTTDAFFEMTELPSSLGVLGLGAIGLEMGLAASRLGVNVTGADLAAVPAGIADPLVAARARTQIEAEFPLWLGSPAEVYRAENGGIRLRSGDREVEVERLLVAMGRRPNLAGLGLEAADVALDARGIPIFDPGTMQIAGSRIFIAGDANADRPLMHEAADEGTIAGYNACRSENQRFKRRVPLGIAFTSPDIASVGARFDQLDQSKIIIGEAEGSANGRSRIVHGENALLRVYADSQTGQLLGASLFAIGGEHLAHLLAWSIQRKETAAAVLQLPFYHPVLEELLQTALLHITSQLPSFAGLPQGLEQVDER